MVRIVTKSMLLGVVASSVVSGAVVTSQIIDNKSFASEITNQKMLSYNEKKDSEEESKTVTVEEEKVKVTPNKSKSVTTTKKEDKKETEKVAESTKTEQKQTKTETTKEEAKAKDTEEVVEEVRQDKVETNTNTTNTKTTTTNSSTNNNQSSNVPSPVESPSPTVNELEVVKKAIDSTINAKNMTVVNHVENSTRKFNKGTGEEYAVYRNALSLTEKAGSLYSYKVNSTKTISLFKENGGSEWKMVFSGKRSLGVIELELIKKASSAETVSEGSYNVKVSYKDAKSWLMNYYGSSSFLSGDVTIAVKTSNGYVQSIKGTVGNVTIDLTLSNIGSTTVPSRSSLGIDDDTINSLEEEYRAHYDCERENDYWVCGPNKHVNQHNF